MNNVNSMHVTIHYDHHLLAVKAIDISDAETGSGAIGLGLIGAIVVLM